MKLYNTLSKTIDELKPLSPPVVTVYTCGPTVYDYPHVGNWFTFIRYDLLIRSLKINDFEPNWVMNITDVGHLVSDADDGKDKLEKGAEREGKTAWEIARFYSDYFVSSLSRLNITRPQQLPKATEHIPEQINLIQKLEAKGFTYLIQDGLYFDTAKFPRYANFAELDIDEQQAGARVEYNPEKRSLTDFALWKLSPAGQTRDMEWDSPWGKGFPGWHIECSAMSMKYLGETLDIHSGGIDHIPVHHSNEIAQSEAATGKPFANHWMHTNHITVEGEKVSKSLGNGITLEDIESNNINLMAFRLHVLESHYRSQSKFSWQSLEAAQNRLHAYFAMADQQWQCSELGTVTEDILHDNQSAIGEALQSDLDTPRVLALLSQLETTIDKGGINISSQETFRRYLRWLDEALGLRLAERRDITDDQKHIIARRASAREAQDWAQSDMLRDRLFEQGIGLKDTAQQGTMTTRWFKL